MARKKSGKTDLKRLYQLSSEELGGLIEELRAKRIEERIKRLCSMALGTPYQPQPWEGSSTFHLQSMDCLTFVEEIMALALAPDRGALLPTLRRLRFKNGEVGPFTRNHFITADWLPNNSTFLEDITPLLGGSDTRFIEKYINKKEFFRKRGLTWDGEPTTYIKSAYLPRSMLPSLLPSFPPLTIVAVVKERPDVVITHLGFGLHDSPTVVGFIHTSQEMKMVAKTDLLYYIKKDREILGIKVIRLQDKWRR